jgi:hypothetical protein
MVILVLASGLGVGCAGETTTYYNRQFGYSVQMPKSWVVDEQPYQGIPGEHLQNAVLFGSEESFPEDWVEVAVIPGKSASSAIIEQHLGLNTEYKVHEYGKDGYVLYVRVPSAGGWSNWIVVYYIEQDGFLYHIKFNEEGTQKKAYVSIDGYGKVNY